MRSLAGYEPGVPIRIELLRAGEPLQLFLVPEPASPEHLAALAIWMKKLRLCFEDNICQPCMAPSNSCAAQTDEMRKIEASEELEEQIKSRPGVVFDLSRDPSGKAMLSSPEIELPSSLDPERYAYLTPRFRELQHGQSMRIRLTIEENGRVRTRILELPHSRIELP